MSVPFYEALMMVAQGARDVSQMEADHENTMFLALTQKDAILIGCALPALESFCPEIGPASEDFQLRLVEALRVQRPEWATDGGTEE